MYVNEIRTIALVGLATIVGCVETGDPVQDPPEIFKVLPPDEPGPGGPGGPTAPPPYTFKSSVGVGGTGAIRDLKFEKDGTSNQTPLGGYHFIWADLNKGAGGTYIYLTFTRDVASVQGNDHCGWTESEYVTALHAQDYNFFDAGIVKGNCEDDDSPKTPIWEGVANYWRHPDLNDGAGGRFIFAWQFKEDGDTPMSEVGVVSGGGSSIPCPSGWTKVNQDLNQGAGGDYIYFCYKN